MYIIHPSGERLYHWNIKNKTKTLKPPESKYFWNYDRESKKLVSSYIDSYSCKDPIFSDYLKKLIALNYNDFYAFKKSIEKQFPNQNLKVYDCPQFYENIYNQQLPKRKITIGIHLKAFIRFFTFFLHSLADTLFKSDAIALPEVLYVRKKPMPDLSMSESLERLVTSDGVSFSRAFCLFGKKKSKHGFNFLNNYKGSFFRSLQSFISSSLFILKYCKHLNNLGLSRTYLYDFCKYSYLISNVCNINSKVICGVLLDKPYFVLINLLKKQDQKVIALNESFSFAPYTNFDFNHLDIYCAMNPMELSNFNETGGNVKRIEFVEFYRKNLKSKSKGISEDLKCELENYNNKVILTTCQTPTDTFFPWSVRELVLFLQGSLEAAKRLPDVLFVLKGKKGELEYLTPQQRSEIEGLPNIYIIDSVSPKLSDYNQFEDIIDQFDVLISMAIKSTTMWQALSHKIKIIGVNDNHGETFLKSFNQIEVPSSKIYEALDYHLNHEKDEHWENTRQELVKLLNMNKSNGLEKVSQIISEEVRA